MKLILEIKQVNGKYKTKTKEVENERHAQNYEAFLLRKGVKIVSTLIEH